MAIVGCGEVIPAVRHGLQQWLHPWHGILSRGTPPPLTQIRGAASDLMILIALLSSICETGIYADTYKLSVVIIIPGLGWLPRAH